MKKVKILVASVLFCAMGYVGYAAHEKMTTTEAEEFMKANIEALTSGEPGGGEVVKCYCKTGLFSGKICSTKGKGSYCGGNPRFNGSFSIGNAYIIALISLSPCPFPK